MKKEQIISLILATMIITGSTTVVASASEPLLNEAAVSDTYSFENNRIVRNYLALKGIPSKDAGSYQRPTVVIAGKTLAVKGIVINGRAYLPFRAAANSLGASYSYDSSTKTSVMKADGLVINAGAGCYTVYANDRALFSETPVVIMNDGRMYIPASIFVKAVGMRLVEDGATIRLEGKYSPLAHASRFYREDEVFWLARIIHAESRGEPLFGKIAVGDVVLNRVMSSSYPNTIYSVIFDRKYGVQFSPILDGSIYNTPDFNSILAAKICLEGYNISREALFFLEPSHSTSSWIPQNREYLFTIGNHDFYK